MKNFALVAVLFVAAMPASSFGEESWMEKAHKQKDWVADAKKNGRVQAAIKARGLNCPSVQRVFDHPEDAYGKVHEVLCENGVRFYAAERPDGSWLIGPWIPRQ